MLFLRDVFAFARQQGCSGKRFSRWRRKHLIISNRFGKSWTLPSFFELQTFKQICLDHVWLFLDTFLVFLVIQGLDMNVCPCFNKEHLDISEIYIVCSVFFQPTVSWNLVTPIFPYSPLASLRRLGVFEAGEVNEIPSPWLGNQLVEPSDRGRK